MELMRVHSTMAAFDAVLNAGNRLNPKDREVRAKIQAAPTLDRVDVHVLVMLPFAAEPAWEAHQNATDYKLDGGALVVHMGGADADGDFVGAAQAVVYPAGSWFKMRSELTQVTNPYLVDPQYEAEVQD